MIFTIALLIGLALIDSTSIGTLIIPIWFLLAAGKINRAGFFLYLATVAFFYFLVGILGLLGMVPFLQSLGDIFTTRIFLYAEIIAGIILVILAFRLDPHRRKATARESRIQRWQRLVLTNKLSRPAIIGLAITATTVELATMAPYIAAITILAASGFTWIERAAVLGGYVIVMILPAVTLLGARLAAHARIQPYLSRFNSWAIKNADDMFSWIIGILGSALACDGIVRLIISITA